MADYVYADADRTLKRDVSGNTVIQYDDNAIIQSVKNIISTITGERVRNPIGSTLVRLLFEPMNNETADSIRTVLFQSVERYDPRISIKTIRVIPNYDNNTYDVTVRMQVKRLTNIVKFETKLRSLYA